MELSISECFFYFKCERIFSCYVIEVSAEADQTKLPLTFILYVIGCQIPTEALLLIECRLNKHRVVWHN